MDLTANLILGGQNLLNCLNPEVNYLPYWQMAVDENHFGQYQFRRYCTGHNVGRWWNTMLRLERSTGFGIPAEVESAMLENSWRLADNPTGIFLEDIDPKDPATWYIHSYRETMLSFGLLAGLRSSASARDHGLLAIERMSRASENPNCWRLAGGVGPPISKTGRSGEPAYTHGRAIEGLLCFYEETGETAALEEAERLAEFHFLHTVSSDGTLAEGCGHHTHSYLNTIRGLIGIAGLKRDTRRLQQLHQTYQRTISQMITRSGFITHDIGARHGGDIASAGDIAHIALLLWDHFKDPRLLDDAERIVRSRLIPAQVPEPVEIQPVRNEPLDCFRDLNTRFVGAIGGAVGHIRGVTCVTDFTAAALHSLIEIYDRVVEVEDEAVRINFHFTRKLPAVRVKSARDETTASVSVVNQTGKDMFIRIPLWVPLDTINLTADARPVKPDFRDGFAFVPRGGDRQQVELRYGLPTCCDEEDWRDEDATQESVSLTWRGDEVLSVDVGGPYLSPHLKVCRRL